MAPLLIVNPDLVEDREVVQLETAIGAAIGSFEHRSCRDSRLLNESGSKLVTCDVKTGSATLEYVNSALYGKKTLTMKWGTTGLLTWMQ